MKQENEKFCAECGQLINIKAELCPKCGVRQHLPSTQVNQEINEQRNKWITCLLLCWFLGVFGVHRFYTGHTAIGVVQVLTFGGCGIWALIDLIRIITGVLKPNGGDYTKTL